VAAASCCIRNRKGYGYACLKGMEHFERNKTRYCRFLDGDYSDYPELTQLLLILNNGQSFCYSSAEAFKLQQL
jgi:hypothetical protein